ncbi:MAG TPA: hypothetical protein VN620_15825, partial [Candidatus Methylomirabilis sp.]|nr:hypothetical protein [Candidatus Methylomirabilis sp.]
LAIFGNQFAIAPDGCTRSLIRIQSCAEAMRPDGERRLKKILNQREIDAILGQALADGSDRGTAPQRPVELCNFRKTGQMSDHYARFMTSLFEVFARSVSNSLGAYFT